MGVVVCCSVGEETVGEVDGEEVEGEVGSVVVMSSDEAVVGVSAVCVCVCVCVRAHACVQN